jgi:hypothetical protein
MQVRYYCKGCGRNKQIEVPVRGENETITEWIRRISYVIMHDHEKNSPTCTEQRVDLAIATDDDKPIGAGSNRDIPVDLMNKWQREREN